MNIQKIKNYLGKYPRIKSFIKKIIIASPVLKEYITKKYGILRNPHYLTDNTITTSLQSEVQHLSHRGARIYKDIKCLKEYK